MAPTSPDEQIAIAHADEQASKFTPKLSYEGWGEPETTYRWSTEKKAVIEATFEPYDIAQDLTLQMGSLGAQMLTLTVNGEVVHNAVIDGSKKAVPIIIPKTVLQEGHNVFTFDLPDAASPATGDPRTLAITISYPEPFGRVTIP